jgi:hypothetical protein
MKQFVANKRIPALKHPPPPLHSPDLALCDFNLFPKVKSVLEGSHFRPADEVKSKTEDLLNRVSADALQHCSEHWGEYSEEDRSKFVEF